MYPTHATLSLISNPGASLERLYPFTLSVVASYGCMSELTSDPGAHYFKAPPGQDVRTV
jgi:hypothetical protein